MGLVRVLVNAYWDTGCPAQRVLVDWVSDGDCSSICIRAGFSLGALLALQTVFSEEDKDSFLDSRIRAKIAWKVLERFFLSRQ